MPTTQIPNDGGNLVIVYAVYGAASLGLTIWLASTLFKNGKTFLHDVFDEHPDMGDAVNRLLVVGFFMLNLGYAFLILRAEPTATTEEAVQLLINRLGLLLVSLGIIHFVNMAVFWRIRRRTQMGELPPPVPPQVILGPTPPPPAPRPPTGPAPQAPAPTGADRVPAGVGAHAGHAGPAGAGWAPPQGGAPDYRLPAPPAPAAPPAGGWNQRVWADARRQAQ